MMTTKIFNNLRDRYQILDNIPIRLPGKYEKCYSGKTANVGMYDAMFAVGLRLPLTILHRQLAIFLGFYVSQIAPNAWRIFIGAEILWGRLSGGNCQLTLDKFFWCYRPQHISSLNGYTILQLGIRHLGWCLTCPTPIELEGQIFLRSKDRLGMLSGRVGDDASRFWQYLGHCQRFRSSVVCIFIFSLLICSCLIYSAFFFFN